MSSAFDCVDYLIMSQCLHDSFGVRDTALSWLKSFLSNRMMRVSVGSASSSFSSLCSGVPQGSVLGPLLFSFYISGVVPLIHRHDLKVHLFADDILVYGSCSFNDDLLPSSRMSQCLQNLQAYLSSLKLLINPDKTKFMWSQSPRQRRIVVTPVTFNNISLPPVKIVKYLSLHYM